MKTQCKFCGSSNLSWFCGTHNTSDAVDGRLRMHDVSVHFVQGCNDCSETVAVVPGEQIAEHFNQLQIHPEVSLKNVINASDPVYVDLSALERLSGPERAAMLKLSIASEKPTGSVSRPSAHFAVYVQFAVSDELTKASPAPRDVMRERLWAAAQHDVFTNTGGIASMLDAGGLARVDYAQYQSVIDAGLRPLIEAGY